MTLRAYGADETLWTVRSLAGPSVETMTRGYRLVKKQNTVAAIVTAAAVNAQPSRFSETNQTTASAARMPASSTTDSSTPCRPSTWVQMMRVMTRTALTGANRRASPQARSWMSSTVFRARKVDPSNRQITTSVSPDRTEYQLSRS